MLQVTTGVGGTPYLDYTFDGTYRPRISAPSERPRDGNLVITLACFAAGTRIATERGEMPVRGDGAAGDRVLTARRAGRRQPVRWIGHRHVSLRAHPDPAAVRPIRIRAGAFGAALPRRDLRLSPDHAVLVGGALIPVRYLVNGATIAPDGDVRRGDVFPRRAGVARRAAGRGAAGGESIWTPATARAFANGGAGRATASGFFPGGLGRPAAARRWCWRGRA